MFSSVSYFPQISGFFFSKSLTTLKKFTIDEACVCVFALASNSSETINVIIIKLGTVTAST